MQFQEAISDKVVSALQVFKISKLDTLPFGVFLILGQFQRKQILNYLN